MNTQRTRKKNVAKRNYKNTNPHLAEQVEQGLHLLVELLQNDARVVPRHPGHVFLDFLFADDAE